MTGKVLVLQGDGIGPEIVAEALRLLQRLRDTGAMDLEWQQALIGGCAFDAVGQPLPEATFKAAQAADAVLLGAVGGPKWDHVAHHLRPESGLLALRSALGVFANLRPVICYAPLVSASSLKPEYVADLDVLIVRELISGIYFGKPRGIAVDADGRRSGFNTMRYTEKEIERIAHVAFAAAAERKQRLCSVDKANVLETSQLWREVVRRVAKDYPQVELSHLYVDNAAMQLVRDPKQFDVIVTGNMFGDILSDLAAMLSGSIGMLASASMGDNQKGLYEPIHGSAPDLAGRGIANPLAMLLSVAMMLRHSFNAPAVAERIESAIIAVLEQGLRTADLVAAPGAASVNCQQMGSAVLAALDL